MNNNTPVLETINNLISFIDNNTNNDEQKQDTQIFEKAVGCEKQTYITLTTKVNENKTNISKIPSIGFGVLSF